MKIFRKNKTLVRLLKYLTSFIFLVFFLLFLLFSLVYLDVFGRLPDNKKLSSIINEEASLVYSSDTIIIGKIFAENRTNIKLEQIPNHLKKALIATEDKRFYSHLGYDSRSYLRVLFKSILMRDQKGGGGSTITQQLIKNLYGRQYSGFLNLPVNKIKELITAKRIEKIYTKDEILLLYLNSVPFGEDIFGVESAANRFFNKSVSELKVEESAVLIGMLKANTYYNPRLKPKNSLNRRNTVLQLMNNEQYLSYQATDSLQKLPLTLNYENVNLKTTAGYFVYQVKKKVTEILESVNETRNKNYNLETEGLEIHTTLNYSIQKIAEKAAKEQLISKQKQLEIELRSNSIKAKWFKKQEGKSLSLEKDKQNRNAELFDWDSTKIISGTKFDILWHYAKMLNASVLITNPKNGAVISWVGGNNFRMLPFDMVLSHRQIASAFKPVLYATAIENGFSPCDYLENEEKTYPEFENWKPQNADYSSTPDSKVALWYALIHSMNLPTIDLYFKLERELLINSCKKLKFPEITGNAPSIALGTLDLSLFEIIRAYGTFANKGEMNDLYMISKITDKAGNIIYESKEEKAERIFKTESCQTLTAILQQAVEQGTGSNIRNKYDIKSQLASKTGTAQSYTDAWFIAYTPNIVFGTWVGTSENSIHFNSGKGSGSSLALPIIANILKEIEKDTQLKNKYLTSFDIPKEIYSSIQCPPYKQKGIKGFWNRLFKKKTK
ncbi:transglycosylase domain-containing protein [Polaribacter glomeratus]|uniref:transglycosylase domain-containing protein n=1 Tax=Polaribacter glomeratus TaxID=102 RepID=UPI000CF442FC|nr:transglycosylase domain-containing protein [Polaribacter glomeratus]TXD67088.1 penicillin-binding protein [Polaribacter glomeratus]